VTHGKPQLDKETGMTSYIDESGNKREINFHFISTDYHCPREAGKG
jgi:hypothetical protein